MTEARQLFYFQTPLEYEYRNTDDFERKQLLMREGVTHHILFTAFMKKLKKLEKHEQPFVHDETHGGIYFILSFPANVDEERIELFTNKMVRFIRKTGRFTPI